MIRPGVLRTAVFGLALAALLVTATSGAAQPVVQVLFTTYVVVATIWVRAQYEDSLDGDPQLLPRWMAVGTALLGLVLVAAFVITRVEWVGLAGAILFYFGIGSFVMSWRETESRRTARGLVLLAIGVVAAAAGFGLLGRLSGWLDWLPLALAALALLILLPVGMALLAEEAIRWLTDDRSRAWRRRGFLGGVLLFCLVAAAAVLLAESLWVLVPLLVLGYLVVALASSTQADIAAVLAVIALMGVTPLQATKPAVLDPRGRSNVLVAMGDSYMSGEGASIYYQGTDEGGGNQCRRSPTAWAAMAGLQRPFDAIAFLACSGARTANVRTDPTSKPTPRPQRDEPGTQLAQYRVLQAQKPFTPRLVVLSIGGNDAGFSTIGLMCLAPGDCNTRSGLWTRSLDQVETLLRGTYAEVRQAFPTTPVVVLAYPDPIDNKVNSCGQVALSIKERNFLTDFLQRLNARVEKAAAAYGFYYLKEMETALAASHLQLCDPLNDGRPGLNFIGLRSVKGIAEQRFNPTNWAHSSLHPNERGHAAMLRVFQTWLADMGTLSATAPGSPAAPPEAVQVGTAVEPQCDLFDLSPSGCRPQGRRWAEQQVGRLMLTSGLLTVPAAAAAWAASVAAFGWHRSVARRRRGL